MDALKKSVQQTKKPAGAKAKEARKPANWPALKRPAPARSGGGRLRRAIYAL